MANSVTPGQTASDIDMQARNLTYNQDIYHKYFDTLSYQFYPEVLMFLFKIRGPEDFKFRRFNCFQALSQFGTSVRTRYIMPVQI